MPHGRTVALFLALTVAGCASAGSSVTPPAPEQLRAAPQYPTESSAARHILANTGRNAGSARATSSSSADDDDGWSDLVLPTIVSCGNGTFATDCGAWHYAPAGAGTPPALNFCRDAALYPGDLGPSATPLSAFAPATFFLSYTGTRATPIVSFATRWWNVRLSGGFSGKSRTAPGLTVTPLPSARAARGWLLFFTWSWPADVLLVPFALDQIQVAGGSGQLAVPADGSAPLHAFDCLGRSIAASEHDPGIGFSADLTAPTVTSPGNVFWAPVFGGSAPAGTIVLRDDRGALTTVPVVTATPSPGR